MTAFATGPRQRRAGAYVAIGGAALALAALPWLRLPAFYASLLYLVLHWAVLATSWNLLSGYSGYISFGHGAFYGTGVYATAVLAGTFDVPFLWTLPAAALAAAILGVALGAVVFRVRRVRGEAFALVTLAVTFVVATIVANTPIDGGPGVYLSSVPVPTLAPTPSGTFYLLALALATASVLAARTIAGAKLGLGLFAIHDDEDVAEVMGVPTYRYKLVAFGMGCALAGAAGGVHALFLAYVTTAGTFNVTLPLTVVLMCVLGGTRHWAGPLVGAAAITLLLYATTAADHALVGKALSGAILVAAVLFMPRGILGWRRDAPAASPRAPVLGASSTDATFADDAAPAASIDATLAVEAAPATTKSDADSRDAAARVAGWPEAAPPAADASRLSPGSARSSRVDAAPLLAVRGVAKAFKGVRALDGVDLDVHDGEIVGVIGPNGSGKSTLINVVSGHFAADGGRIAFRGDDIARWTPHRIARAGVARTYQVPRPFAGLTVAENVALPAMFGAAALDRGSAAAAADECLAFTGLAARGPARPDALNLHETKFLELARALASAPRLLMLDEVLSGLSPPEIDDAVALIGRIRARGTAIVLVEHVLRVVTALSDRVIVLDQGRVLAQGPAAAVMARDDVARAYLGATGA